MNKAELIEAIADHADLIKADAGSALEGFCEAITDAIKKGEDPVLPWSDRNLHCEGA